MDIKNAEWHEFYEKSPVKNNYIDFINTCCKNNIILNAALRNKRISKNELSVFIQRIPKDGCGALIFDNTLALRTFAGNKDQLGRFGNVFSDSSVTFGLNEMKKILKDLGVSDYDVYYLYPDWKLLFQVYSDDYLPKEGELTNNQRNFAEDRLVLFDENDAWDSIISNNLFPEYSNSYLILIKGSNCLSEDKIIFSKYSNDRSREFSIRTDIVKLTDGAKVVRKVPMNGSAFLHIRHMQENGEKLNDLYRNTCLNYLQLNIEDNYGYYPFIEANTLDERLVKLKKEGNEKELLENIDYFINAIKQIDRPDPLNVDCIFKNIICDNDNWIVIDYEWTLNSDRINQLAELKNKDAEPDSNFIIFRALYYFIQDNRINGELLESLRKKMPLSDEQINAYLIMEREFQKMVNNGHVSLSEFYGTHHGKNIYISNELNNEEKNNFPFKIKKKNGEWQRPELWREDISDDLHNIVFFTENEVYGLKAEWQNIGIIFELQDEDNENAKYIKQSTISHNGFKIEPDIFLFPNGGFISVEWDKPIEPDVLENITWHIIFHEEENSAAFMTLCFDLMTEKQSKTNVADKIKYKVEKILRSK